MLFQYFLIYLEQFNLVFAYWCLTTFASKKKKEENLCTLLSTAMKDLTT